MISFYFYTTMADNKGEEAKWEEPAENPASMEKIKAMLEEHKVKYDLSSHKAVLTSEEAAAVRGVSVDSGAKAMLLKDTGKKLTLEDVPFYLAVLSASKRFSSKTFKKLINWQFLNLFT